MFQIRDYQQKAHNDLIEGFKQSKKMLLVMATGSGKSKTAISFVDKYSSHYIFIIAVRTRDLVNQLAQDLDFFNLDYGVFMAGHEKYSPKKEIQLCSIDTIHSREVYPHRWSKKDIVLIIDEADQSKADGYQQLINVYCNRKSFVKPSHVDYSFRNAFLFGMTATPYNGLNHFDDYIQPITPIELNKKGVLVDYVYYIPKTAISLEDVEIKKGEYVQKQVELKLNTPSAIKDCFNSWLEYGDNRQTLVFCVNQDHAKSFCKYINAYYGKHVAEFVDSNTPEDERQDIYNDFRGGMIRFLINVRLITRGVNIIEIGCILDCASTLSINLHIQKLGRGSRENDIYDDCIVIDCANNLVNNGHFYQAREIDLTSETSRSKKDLDDIQMRVCGNCFRAGEVLEFRFKCPYCGHKMPKIEKPKLSKYQKNKLFMESASEEAIEQRQLINEYKKIVWQNQNLKKLTKSIALQKATEKMLSKYGKSKCLKISKAINLTDDVLNRWEIRNSYQPLGGLM